jgi:hypothetical protein
MSFATLLSLVLLVVFLPAFGVRRRLEVALGRPEIEQSEEGQG